MQKTCFFRTYPIRHPGRHSARKVIFSLMIGLSLMIFVLFACSPQKQDGSKPEQADLELRGMITQKEYEDTLIREILSDPQSLNPVLSNDSQSAEVIQLIFEPLLHTDTNKGTLIGRLAEKWTISEDGKELTFYLRNGIRWHDGMPFTAEDVRFTWETAKRNDIPSLRIKSQLELVDRVEVLSHDQVKVILKTDFAPGLQHIGSIPIIPRHLLDKASLEMEATQDKSSKPVTFVTSRFNRAPVGTGPYRFTSWKSMDHIKLTRFDDYWDSSTTPSINEIMFRIVPNGSLAYNMLQKGDLDVFRCRIIQYQSFKRKPHLHKYFRAEKYFKPAYFYIGWNNRPDHPFFSDSRVRRAMTHACDREAIASKVQYGMANIITGPYFFQSWAYNSHIEPLAYDLQKAREILEEAGWIDSDGDGIRDKKSMPFKCELLVPAESATFQQLASIFQANAKLLSIDVTIQSLEWSAYVEKTSSGSFDAYLGGWTLGRDPDIFGTWHSSQIGAGNNEIGYTNKKVDELLELARRQHDQAERRRLCWQIHQLIHEDQPCTFLYTPMETYLVSKRIKNMTQASIDPFDFFAELHSWSLQW